MSEAADQNYLWALDNIIIWIATFLGWNKVHSTQTTIQFKGNHRMTLEPP